MTLATRGANKVKGFVPFDLAAASEYDLRACFCEQDSGIAPNTRSSPRDERYLVFKFLAHGLPFPEDSRLATVTATSRIGIAFCCSTGGSINVIEIFRESAADVSSPRGFGSKTARDPVIVARTATTAREVQPAKEFTLSPTTGSPGRLLSLDIYRGLMVASMILVDNPGSDEHAYWPIMHAKWNGWTPADFIFPSFLFLVGISLVYSFDARRQRGETSQQILWHSFKRTLILIAIGLLVNASPIYGLDVHTWRFEVLRSGLAFAILLLRSWNCGAGVAVNW